jgi:hypothetical protein
MKKPLNQSANKLAVDGPAGPAHYTCCNFQPWVLNCQAQQKPSAHLHGTRGGRRLWLRVLLVRGVPTMDLRASPLQVRCRPWPAWTLLRCLPWPVAAARTADARRAGCSTNCLRAIGRKLPRFRYSLRVFSITCYLVLSKARCAQAPSH